MPLSQTSIAKAVGVGINNVQHGTTIETLPRKIFIIGTFDPAKTAVVNDVPVQVFSPEDCGAQQGFGFMTHRMAKAAFKGSNGVECWVIPQDEAIAAVEADGSIDFTGSVITAAGTVYFYVAGEQLPLNVAVTTDADAMAIALVAVINADRDTPVIAAVDGVITGQVNLTAKSKGPYGNKISLVLNLGLNQELPVGAVAVITDMTSGAGTPDVDDALNGMGTGDAQNENYWTDGAHGYLVDSDVLTKISTYNGIGNDYIGNYTKTVSRPFRVFTGDADPGTAALTALAVIGNANKLDRTNGIIPVPDSASHPSEVAALACGVAARIANDRPEQPYGDQILSGVWPGATANRWTKDYDNRDIAKKAGICTTFVKNNAVYLSDVVSMYHPDDVPVTSNIYRAWNNLSKTQNILSTIRANFESSKYQGITIVEDKTRVTRSASKEKVRDIKDVIGTCISIATGAYESAWLYNDSFTINRLTDGGYITIKVGGNGFDIRIPVIYSGNGDIFDVTVEADVSLSVLG